MELILQIIKLGRNADDTGGTGRASAGRPTSADLNARRKPYAGTLEKVAQALGANLRMIWSRKRHDINQREVLGTSRW